MYWALHLVCHRLCKGEHLVSSWFDALERSGASSDLFNQRATRRTQ